jgi:hypothetical protein
MRSMARTGNRRNFAPWASPPTTRSGLKSRSSSKCGRPSGIRWRLRAGKPPEGWGEDPKKIEALIKDDPQALSMWDDEMKGSHGGDHGNQYAKKVGKSDNITLGKRGNSKAHSLSVLKRKAPDMFQAVRKRKAKAWSEPVHWGRTCKSCKSMD